VDAQQYADLMAAIAEQYQASLASGQLLTWIMLIGFFQIFVMGLLVFVGLLRK